MATEKNNNINTPFLGMTLDSVPSQRKATNVVYALNAVVEGSTNDSIISYQNEESNILCCSLPEGYNVIGVKNIIEENIIILLLVNPTTGKSEIGKVINCTYSTYINPDCLNFKMDDPVLEFSYKKTNCSTEIYWASKNNGRRYLDIYNKPFINDDASKGIDCNKLLISPVFSIPKITINDVKSGGDNQAGVYQFAVQYSNSISEPYTSFYSVTNPTPLFDSQKITLDFNYIVGKTIEFTISDLDTSGYYDYINVAVIRTINNISSVELIGTYAITNPTQKIYYSGQKQLKQLFLNDIFLKYPIYEKADSVYNVQDILGWYGLTTQERVNYQSIASEIELQWETYRLKGNSTYKNELNINNFTSYLRDEIYPFEIVFFLTNGHQTDGFTIPLRKAKAYDLQLVNGAPRWKVENTANLLGYSPEYLAAPSPLYEGAYEFGEFAYWESVEKYPDNPLIYGALANQPIRHHKFPDSKTTHIHEDEYIYPIGVKLDVDKLKDIIRNSNLTLEQKNSIQGFKIVRGNRAVHKSIIAKGIIRDVLQYSNNGNPIDISNNFDSGGSSNYILAQLSAIKTNVTSSKTNDIRTWANPIEQTVGETQLNIQYSAILFQIDTFLNSSETTIPLGILYPNRIPLGSTSLPATYITELNTALTNINDILNTPILGQGLAAGALSYLTPSSSQVDNLITQYNSVNGSSSGTNPNSLLSDAKITNFYFPNYGFNDTRIYTQDGREQDNYLFNIKKPLDERRYTFHSPDTSFYQPALGNKLKVESLEYGNTQGRWYQTKNHAGYKIFTKGLYGSALVAAAAITFASRWVIAGVSTGGTFADGTAAIQTYQIIVNILEKCVPFVNYAYQFNAIANYTEHQPINTNLQDYSKDVEIGAYLNSEMLSVGDDLNINNWQRESSVYFKLKDALPVIETIYPLLKDNSKDFPQEINQTTQSISSVYYASIKNEIVNQWGQLYAYETIDTGFQESLSTNKKRVTIFGGDTFINKFSFKTKIPFFLDNRVGFSDGSDIFYDDLSNVGECKYWYTAKTKAQQGEGFIGSLTSTLFGTKAHRLYDSSGANIIYRTGQMFLFNYGIPTFYVESTVNVDLRQAFNSAEGDFFPHVGTFIPNDWLQEINVPIVQDNTYYYNKTFSKQNKETFFSHLPIDWDFSNCRTYFPYRTIFSEEAKDFVNPSIRNNWLVYKASSYYDFPQNYGKLTSITGIENKQALVRFENKTLLYNALLTAPTSTSSIYLGQSLFSQQTPPLDYSDTDLGYVGAQHKFLLKTEYGHVSLDAKRGQVFLLQGQKAEDISSDSISRFLIEYLNFSIQKQFPTYPIDNHFNGIGLHGVYDSKYNRLIITKLDYECLDKNMLWDGIGFYLPEIAPTASRGNTEANLPPTITITASIDQGCNQNTGFITVTQVSGGEAPYYWYLLGYNNTPREVGDIADNLPNGTYTVVVGDSTQHTTEQIVTLSCVQAPPPNPDPVPPPPPPPVRNYIQLSNTTYFCNKSFTISYAFNNKAWISFHSYLPNFYIGNPNYFYSGINNTPSSIWKHSSSFSSFNTFYGKIQPYVLEVPYFYGAQDEILQSIKDYTTVLKIDNFEEFTESDDDYFNKMIIYSNQQCSGLLKLTKKPISNLKSYNEFPKYFDTYKEVLYVKSDNLYKVNTFWSLVKNNKKPIFSKTCENLSIFKTLNQDNMEYNKNAYKKGPIRSQNLKVRYILDDLNNIKIVSTINSTETMKSFK